MLPPAPDLLSVRTCWPTWSPSVFPMMRETVSVPPPGAKPTTVVIGRPGNGACAKEAVENAIAATYRNVLFMCPPSAADGRDALVGQPEAVDHVARQRLHQLQLRAHAHLRGRP